MRKQNNLVTYLTLVCSVCSLVLSLLAFLRSEDTATMVDLQAQNIQLQSQIDKLTNRMGNATEVPTYPASTAHASLVVESFHSEDVLLILDSAYVQVQLPQTSANGLTIRRAELVLIHHENELYQQDITLEPGEGEGGYEAALRNITLPLPELTADEHLELLLEITLSDGQSFRSPSAGWYVENDQLLLIAG